MSFVKSATTLLKSTCEIDLLKRLARHTPAKWLVWLCRQIAGISSYTGELLQWYYTVAPSIHSMNSCYS